MEIQKTINNVDYQFSISFNNTNDNQYIIGNINVTRNTDNFRLLENNSEILRSILHKALQESFQKKFYLKNSNIDTGSEFSGVFQNIYSQNENIIEIPVRLETANAIVNVKLQVLEDFSECTKLESSPFNFGRVFRTNTPEAFDFFEKIVIKGDIDEDQRLPIITYPFENGEKTIETAINIFINEMLDNSNSYNIYETFWCNQFEQQVKYIVMPRREE